MIAATGQTVETVLVGGDVLVEGGRLTRVDEHALREEAEQTSRRILAKIGIEPTTAWPVH